jgi:hypothetical protein
VRQSRHELVSEVKTEITAKNGVVTVLRSQQVDAILALNKRAFNDAPTWRPYASGRKDVPLRRVAEIPLVVVEQWFKEGINIYSPDPDMQKAFRKKLNDYNKLSAHLSRPRP